MATAYKIGCFATDDMTGKTAVIITTFGPPGANTSLCMKRNGVDYAVTAGKTLHITGLFLNYCSADTILTLLYADDAGAMLTNPVTICGLPGGTIATSDAGKLMLPFYGTVPAGKYLGIHVTANGSVQLTVLGYEA